ncbi:UvrD-helicase domain-containing protein [Pedobacter sp. SYSU D00535]|uniref:UvrD-helicase domain-containing protein n=1 Tax=Pedobacter sp. SYSU D00535 TaxID=2810308 RepID=UPI001A979817|nr:ATP-dependent helicase [Pedobacter sp. SYSU D00535]
MPIIINSDDIVVDIEQHFKVLAGPGAGKTTFLVNHIKNILNNSRRLKIQGKIACITYTNVATETILKRVGDHAGRLEISTIHSFLYEHIVKPYVHLIAEDYELDAKNISGHDDIVLSGYQTIEDWKARTGQRRLRDNDLIVATWDSLQWKFNPANTDELIVRPPRPVQYFSNDGYLEYKKILWSKGLLHHDDVLFFSYELIKKRPFILTVLRAKFPYFLIDEFQDTSPIQIALLKSIGAMETIVGVVGDEMQSIYSFLGAIPGQLRTFSLPNICEYEIQGNWRSTNEIVDLLNKVRPDLTQKSLRNVSGSNPTIIVGDKLAALSWVANKHPTNEIFSLCRENSTANALEKGLGINTHSNLLQELKAKDTTSERRRAVSDSIKAVEYARLGFFKDALKTLGKLFNRNKTVDDKKQTLIALKKLLANYSSYSTGNLINMVDFIRTNIKSFSNLRAGGAQTFYNSTPYTHVAIAVKNLCESGNCRTIHKAKGDEFECVLVILEATRGKAYNENTALSFLLNTDLTAKEEHRVQYVAISRAKEHLYISTPALSRTNKTALEAIGFNVQILP